MMDAAKKNNPDNLPLSLASLPSKTFLGYHNKIKHKKIKLQSAA